MVPTATRTTLGTDVSKSTSELVSGVVGGQVTAFLASSPSSDDGFTPLVDSSCCTSHKPVLATVAKKHTTREVKDGSRAEERKVMVKVERNRDGGKMPTRAHHSTGKTRLIRNKKKEHIQSPTARVALTFGFMTIAIQPRFVVV